MTHRPKLVALSLTALLALTACSGNDNNASNNDSTNNETTSNETAKSDENITLDFAIFSPDQEPTIQKVVDAFEAEHTNIDVSLRVIPWVDYWNTLKTTASGGTGPDVAWMLGAQIAPYLEGKALLPLDDAIKEAGIDTSGYPQMLLPLYQADGATYALPKDFDTIGLWYNKDLFDKAGIAYPDASWTWDTVAENAAKLTDSSANQYGIAAPIDAQAGYYNTIPQAGGFVISPDGTKSGYDDPKSIEGIAFWTDLVAKGYSPSLQSFADTEAVAQFMSGNIAMMYTGSYFAGRFANDEYASTHFDVAPMPKGPASNASVINGMGNVAFANSKHPKEAAELATFLSSPEASTIQSESGAVIGSYKGTQQAWVDALPMFHAQVFLDAVDGAVVYPTSKNTDAWASREGELLTPAWTGDQTPAEAAGKLAAAMNDALAAE